MMTISASRQTEIDGFWTDVVADIEHRRAKAAGVRFASSPPPAQPQPQRSSAPGSQEEIDAMHSGIVAKLNATLPERWRPR
jgi:hypothetical protein